MSRPPAPDSHRSRALHASRRRPSAPRAQADAPIWPTDGLLTLSVALPTPPVVLDEEAERVTSRTTAVLRRDLAVHLDRSRRLGRAPSALALWSWLGARRQECDATGRGDIARQAAALLAMVHPDVDVAGPGTWSSMSCRCVEPLRTWVPATRVGLELDLPAGVARALLDGVVVAEGEAEGAPEAGSVATRAREAVLTRCEHGARLDVLWRVRGAHVDWSAAEAVPASLPTPVTAPDVACA